MGGGRRVDDERQVGRSVVGRLDRGEGEGPAPSRYGWGAPEKVEPSRRERAESARRDRGKRIGSPSEAAVEHAPDILDVRQVGEEEDEVVQLRVVRVVEPRRDGNSVVWVEDVGRRRVVDDDRLVDRPTKLRQVLRKVRKAGHRASVAVADGGVPAADCDAP